MNNTSTDIKEIIEKSPERCPITGLRRCDLYTIADNVVYLTDPAYYAYTLPSYDEEEKTFYRTKYDLDDGITYVEHLCDLNDLRNREDFKQIKDFYGIKEGN
jgi:hypothetical protein